MTMLHHLGRTARTMPADGLRPGREIVFPSGCPADRIGKPARPVRLLRVREQMPAPDRGEGIASKAMHRADMRSAMAVKILNPEMAAGFLDEFEPLPQQARVAAEALSPDALARPFIEPHRCQHRTWRTPHEVVNGIVAIGIDGAAKLDGNSLGQLRGWQGVMAST